MRDQKQKHRDYMRRYYEEHPEYREYCKEKAKQARWQFNNKEKRNARLKKYRQNPVVRRKLLRYRRSWYAKNSLRINANQRDRRARQPLKYKSLDRKYRQIYDASIRDLRSRRRAECKKDCSSKIRLLRMSQKFCRWCCVRLTQHNFSIDHIVPLARGGRHIEDNLAACCKTCNFRKSDKLVHEWLPRVAIF